MALHLAQNGCYGIKIHPKRLGEDINKEALETILATFGILKELQIPNKHLAFAYYEQHEEARACLDSLTNSKDYNAWPGWPKQTTADEKYKNGVMNHEQSEMLNTKETSLNSQHKDVFEAKEKNLMVEDYNKSSVPKRAEKVMFNLSDVGLKAIKNGQSDNTPKGKVQENVENLNRKHSDKNNNLTSKIVSQPPNYNQKNGKVKKPGLLAKLTEIVGEINTTNMAKAEENKKKYGHISRSFDKNIRPSLQMRSRSEYRRGDENQNANEKTRNRNHSVDKYKQYNKNEKISTEKTKSKFVSKKKSTENEIKNSVPNFHCKEIRNKSDFKSDKTKKVYVDKIDKTQKIIDNQNDKTKKEIDHKNISKIMPRMHCLIPAIDAWTYDYNKIYRSTKPTSYVVLLNLPINITQGKIYDLCKSFVNVIHIELKHGKKPYLSPHAYVHTESAEDSKTLKKVLDGNILDRKVLHVQTDEELLENL